MGAEKRYICSFCARAFSRSEHKQRHERSHTNEKPFHCNHCSSAFVRRDLLQRHCKTVHDIVMIRERKQTLKQGTHGMENERRNSANCISAAEIGTNVDRTTNHGLLLSIARKVTTILQDEEEYDAFLIGYILLAKDPMPIVPEILNSLNKFLQFHETDQTPNFKLCLIYSILSVGHINSGDIRGCIEYFRKAWLLLVQKLIPDYNDHNTNAHIQIEILDSLFILSYTHLKYDFNQYKSLDISCDLNFNYLDDISFIIMSNLLINSTIINSNMDLLWCIYNLLSLYLMNDEPPKFYRLFLNMPVLDLSLTKFMNNLHHAGLTNTFVHEIMISTLSNELNYLIHANTLLIFPLTRALHNSIILMHKIIPESSNIEIYEIFKKKLIIKSPDRFHELLKSYIFNPVEPIHWKLLSILLKEFNLKSLNVFNFKSFINNNLNNSLDSFTNNLLPFFEINNNDINNNLGIVSFPLIFNLQFIGFQKLVIIKSDNLNFQDKVNLNFFIIEWYLTLVKLLINLRKESHSINNCILQCLFYLINDNDLNFEINDEFFWAVFKKLNYYFETWLSFINNQYFLQTFKVNLQKFLMNYIRSTLNLMKNASFEDHLVPNKHLILPPIINAVNPRKNSL